MSSFVCFTSFVLVLASDDMAGDTARMPAGATGLDGTTAVCFLSDLKKPNYCHACELLKHFFGTISSASPCCDIFLKVLSVVVLRGRCLLTEQIWVCVCDWLGEKTDLNIKLHDWL